MAELTHSWSWLQSDDRVRLYSPQQNYTGSELVNYICSLSEQLKKLPDQGNLAACSPNSAKALLIPLACLEAGWCYQPISPRWPQTQRTKLAKQTASTWIWPAQAFDQESSLKPLALDWNIQHTGKDTLTALPQNICSTLLTSGSTGQPKAVSHQIQQHLAAAEFCNPILELDESSCWLMSLPLFHAAGYAILMRCLQAGAAIAMPEQPGVSIQTLKHYPVTHLSLVATQLQRLLQEPEFNASKLSLKHIMLGGGPVPKKLLQQALDKGFKLSMSYGMTESAAAIALSKIDSDSGIEVRNNASLRIHHGEIQLRGPQIAKSYQTPDGSQPLANDEGWFATGDLGAIRQGKLFIKGRKDNRFISGGENIQPELIEQTLQQHPEINMALVVPVEDAEYGQRPVAFIDSSSPMKPEAITLWLKDQLPSFMCPVRYLPWPKQIDPQQKPVRYDFIQMAKRLV